MEKESSLFSSAEVGINYFLPDIEITEYEDLYYPFTAGRDFEVYGLENAYYDLEFTFDLGKAAAFAAFNPLTNTFEIS